ncbi:hypothetical protein ZIOFF_001580 [Zingiber officinale]|uniref:Integrase catalytic domain-containing protein n=1 Tax=Zingiber officinale TaxID=94328 RepID=A0A8J5M8Q1_ZINOF|nr:hypothetical protein ZIOFF_001580 [Zingiber officinale]
MKVDPADQLVKRPITRSIAKGLNKLVSEPIIMGDSQALQQRFDAFFKIYQEDKASNEKRQQLIHAQLEELSKSFSNLHSHNNHRGEESSNHADPQRHRSNEYHGHEEGSSYIPRYSKLDFPRYDGVVVDNDKIDAVLHWPQPTTLHALRGFLGLTGYYRKFVQGYGVLVSPLTSLLRRNSFEWNEAAELSFQKLKIALTSTLVLALPDFSKSFVVDCDASDMGIGAILQQEGRPIAFFSRPLPQRHKKLPAYEKELVGLAKAIHHWRAYLWGYKFLVRTDHYSLKFLLEQQITNSPQQHWISKLLGFDFLIEYQAGRNNVATDSLSRRDNNNGQLTAISMPKLNLIEGIQSKYSTSPEIQHLIQVHMFVRECPICQHNKVEHLKSAGLLQPLSIPHQVWSNISMDFIDGLPPSQGKTVLFVVVDCFSKYAHFIPLSHPYTAVKVAQVFFDIIFKLHDLPETIISDRDTTFISSFWKEPFRFSGTQLCFSSTYHPQSDDQTKVVNRVIEMYLRCFTGEFSKKWVYWISW